jgi:hypothetical protein
MIDVLPLVLTITALAAAAWCGVLMALNKPLMLTSTPTLGVAGLVVLLEIGLLAQAVVGVVNMIDTTREFDKLTFVGYLVGPAVVLPFAGMWSLAERTRWGAGVLLVGCLSVPVMILRLQQIWAGHG